jgi:hypothetical protein
MDRNYPSWNANAGKKISVSIEAGNVMRISGLLIGSIATAEGFGYSDNLWNRDIYNENEQENAVFRHHFWSRVLEQMSNLDRPGQDPLVACSMAITRGLDCYYDRANETERYADFLKYLVTVFDDFPQRYPAIHQTAESINSGEKYAFEYVAWLLNYYECLFTTINGFVGCGSPHILPGDVVCILFGSVIPHILRPKDDHYLHIGMAYVYGMMDGEIVKAWEAGDMPEVEEKVFHIH